MACLADACFGQFFFVRKMISAVFVFPLLEPLHPCVECFRILKHVAKADDRELFLPYMGEEDELFAIMSQNSKMAPRSSFYTVDSGPR